MAQTPVHHAHRDPVHHVRHGEHSHGDMDVTTHQRTFRGFVRFATWNVVAIAIILIFLALANA